MSFVNVISPSKIMPLVSAVFWISSKAIA